MVIWLDSPLYAVSTPSAGPALRLEPATAGAYNCLVVEGAAPGASLTPGIRGPAPGLDAPAALPLHGPFFADEGGRLVLRHDLARALPGAVLTLQSVDAVRQAKSPPLTVTLE